MEWSGVEWWSGGVVGWWSGGVVVDFPYVTATWNTGRNNTWDTGDTGCHNHALGLASGNSLNN